MDVAEWPAVGCHGARSQADGGEGGLGPAGGNSVHGPGSSVQSAGASGLDGGPWPVDAVAAGWSEPPFATIGLGTGTMASYGRPFGYVHYYEIDDHIKRLSLPGKSDKKFHGTNLDPDGVPYFN